jgi:uncharacterized protein YjbI with pentapeptide repeats
MMEVNTSIIYNIIINWFSKINLNYSINFMIKIESKNLLYYKFKKEKYEIINLMEELYTNNINKYKLRIYEYKSFIGIGIYIKNKNINNINLKKRKIYWMTFKNCNIKNIDFNESYIKNIKFNNVIIENCFDMWRTICNKILFKKCQINFLNIVGAKFSNSIFNIK